MKKEMRMKKLLNIYTVMGFTFLLITIILIAIPTAPYIWYRLNPGATDQEQEIIVEEVVNEEIKEEEKNSDIPPLNPNLPQGYFVLIPSVGIDSPISATKDYKVALRKGTWIVNDFGTPEQDSLPIILAAHRFGYTSWSTATRNKIAFYNLPNTKEGDKVHIYWNQREYIYEIYVKEEGTRISDYSADLILYTCKYFNSPIRIFRYANRVN